MRVGITAAGIATAGIAVVPRQASVATWGHALDGATAVGEAATSLPALPAGPSS
jgi:glutaminase